MQSENLNIPEQKKIIINTNIFFSVQKYLFQYPKICANPKIYISVPNYIYYNPKIFISVQKIKFYKKYKHIPSVFVTRRQKGSESFKMADLKGYSKRSNHLLF